MFTGLVEAIGTARDFRRTGAVMRLSIECPEIAPELVYGQSVAVSGACLTVVSRERELFDAGVFDVEMMPETMGRTRFASLSRDTKLNLERALRADGRLDGHLVLGHVDGTATFERMTGTAQTVTAWFRVSPDVARYVVPKGSVAVDGVSLTVIGAESARFSVGLIPTTLKGCTLGELRPGETVNIETDILGKYVERLLNFPAGETRMCGKPGKKAAAPQGLTFEELSNLGY